MTAKIIAANWKMHKTTQQALSFLKNLEKKISQTKQKIKHKMIICAPFTDLCELSKLNKKVKLGAQDIFYQEKGAFTGEISPAMIKEFCNYVIIGHSERRAMGETDQQVNKKIKAALQHNLKVILCVGEKKSIRNKKQHKRFVQQQLKKDFNRIKNLKHHLKSNILIAYEPIWAIGGKTPAKMEQIIEMHQTILNFCQKKFQQKPKVLYGGSVHPKNAKEILSQPVVSGALIGHSSLNLREFWQIIQSV